MCFLLVATLGAGRVAREISVRELSQGISTDNGGTIGSGTGLAENSIRTAVKRLSITGYLKVYKERKANGSDNAARIYEIDFNRLDEAIGAKLAPLGSSKIEGAPFKNCRGIHTSNVVTVAGKEIATSSYIPADSAVVGGGQVEESALGFVGKKPKPALPAVSTSSAEAAVASVAARSRAKVAHRVEGAAKAAPADITRDQMQAVFDSAAKEAGLPYRLMVTAREHGFLRKRMRENPPQDFHALARYAVVYWGLLAQQNRKAVSREAGKVVARKPLPEAPHFQTFVYWYPYFLRAYQNHLAAKAVEVVDERLAPARRRQETVARPGLSGDAAIFKSALRRLAARSAPESDAPPPRPAPRRKPTHDDLKPIDLPVWK